MPDWSQSLGKSYLLDIQPRPSKWDSSWGKCKLTALEKKLTEICMFNDTKKQLCFGGNWSSTRLGSMHSDLSSARDLTRVLGQILIFPVSWSPHLYKWYNYNCQATKLPEEEPQWFWSPLINKCNTATRVSSHMGCKDYLIFVCIAAWQCFKL